MIQVFWLDGSQSMVAIPAELALPKLVRNVNSWAYIRHPKSGNLGLESKSLLLGALQVVLTHAQV